MKKSISIYSIIWTICLVVFNVITFVTPNEIGGVSKFSGSFWVGYIFITIAFIGQLACAFVAFKAENLKKFFYNIPLFSISYGGLVAMLIVGSIFMAIPVLPEWIAIIVCVIILAFNAIAIIKATAAADIVSGIDEKIKTQTFFIKSLSVDAQSLMTSAKSDELRVEAKKVYEAIRYSDPMANAALSDLDTQIERQFNSFSHAIKAEDSELAKETADALVEMVERRNQKCKLLK
ncbi:MAG: hypothetical protein E7674_08580 [Ruminococcaceae bacterium]|nr:hypothetical protein [Oscillospiraceae bacterium]